MALNQMQKKVTTVAGIIVGSLILFSILKPVIVLRPGKAGVIENRLTGMEKRILKPGVNFLLPLIQRPYIYNVRFQTYTVSGIYNEGSVKGNDAIEALTSDGQPVWMDISLIYKLDRTSLDKFHENIQGGNYVEDILRPTLRSVIRNITSKYSVIELYSSSPEDIAKAMGVKVEELDENIGRMAVQNDIYDSVKDALAGKYIIVDKLLIRNVKFSEEFQKAIERKQIEQQEAEKMNYVLEKAKKEKEKKVIDAEGVKQARIIEAEGESQAISLVGRMLRNNPNVISYEYVQKLAPDVKAIVTDNKAILNLSDFLTKE